MLRVGIINFLEGVVMLFIVKASAPPPPSPRHAPASRMPVRVLHASLAVHNPKLQDECIKFHHHVERAALGFRAMGFTISYHFGASVLYPVVTVWGFWR